MINQNLRQVAHFEMKIIFKVKVSLKVFITKLLAI